MLDAVVQFLTRVPTRAAPQPVLETARLVLRPFAPADADAVQRIASAHEIADATLTIPHPYPPGAAALWIATHAPSWEAGTSAVFALTRRDDDAIVGAMGLGLTDAHLRAELGYWIAVPHWGQGYATEAGAAVLAFAFGPLGLHRVQARHFLRNPASGRVMQKLGMRFEGITRAGMRKGGRFEDLAVYARLATDAGAGDGTHEDGAGEDGATAAMPEAGRRGAPDASSPT